MQIPETGPLLSFIVIPVTSSWSIPQLLLVAMLAAAAPWLLWGMVIWVGITYHLPCQGPEDLRELTRELMTWWYRVNTGSLEGYLLETGTGRLEGRSRPRGWLSGREWIHSKRTGKRQRFCPTTAPEHNEEQFSAGSSSLQWDIMENAVAGRKEGKQVNYTRKLGQGHYRIKEFLFFLVTACWSYDHKNISIHKSSCEKKCISSLHLSSQ